MDRCDNAVGLRNMDAKHANVSGHVSVGCSEINSVKKGNSCQQTGNFSCLQVGNNL